MPIEREDKLAQLDRILNSRTLHGSDSLRAFLRFVVDKTLDGQEGQEGQLKEYVIATEVFGRGKNFDSHLDSVVRVQAGRLRTKLHEYYKTEGRHDPLILDLPKGKYSPSFSLPTEHDQRNGMGTEGDTHEEKSEERLAMDLLWGELIRVVDPVLVVFSNTVFTGDYEHGMKLFNSLSVAESGKDSPALAGGSNGAGELRIDHYTGIGELMSVYFLSDFFARARHPFRLKRSLQLSWDDAKSENIVVLGSPAENFFLLDLPVQQDFVFRWVEDEQHRHVNAIVNTNPQADERESYLAKHFGPSPSQISEDYAVLSMLPGLTEKTRLLILAGINTFGTQAAAEYVTRPECIKDLIARLNTAPDGQPPQLPAYYQVLLRVKVNGGVPVQISYVTHHVLHP